MIRQALINHVVFVVDRSGSMHGLSDRVVDVFDRQVADLARLSKDLDQETRASVYMFSDQVENVAYDQDVLRLPSLRGHYRSGGNTALLDATSRAIVELGQTATLYGDHAFLVYALTDGQENASARTTPSTLTGLIRGLADNWTVAALVPDSRGEADARRFGFLPGNILQWSATDTGLNEAASRMASATASYMRARATGTRGSSGLFTIDVSKIDQKTVNRTIGRLDPSRYVLLDVRSPMEIKPFVESDTGRPYVLGSAHYQLTKRETVQAGKDVVLVHKRTGVAYGGAEARAILGLPAHEVRIEPAAHPDYDVFVQSTSVNRRLVPGTRLLVTT